MTIFLKRLLVLVSLAAAVNAQKKPVTVEAAAGTVAVAPEIVWAPQGDRFAYLESGRIGIFEAASGARRELVSLAALQAAAVPVAAPTAFDWQNRNVQEKTLQWVSNDCLLIRANGDLFLVRISSGDWRQLTRTAEDEKQPQVSPDGRRVSFLRGDDLFVLEIESGAVTRLTQEGGESLRNGRLDWVYPEELGLGIAHWWSPDSKQIAYLQFDVSRQPFYPHADLLLFGPSPEPQRYPKAGQPNAEVRLGVVGATGGATRWMELGDPRHYLLARVHWAPAGDYLLVQRLNRTQDHLDLLRVNPATGRAQVILSEQDRYWINVDDALSFLRNSAEFIWSSERDGFRHLYRYSSDGKLLGRLTSGEWEVSSVACVDEPGRSVYYLSTEAGPLERQLYAVPLEGGRRRRISTQEGTHSVSMAPGCRYYLDTFSSLTTPTRRTVHASSGKELAVFTESDQTVVRDYDLRPVEIVQVKAPDGAVLYARLIRPAGFQSDRKYPAVIFVYGGPHSQNVRNAWQGLSLEQALAHRGFVIWQLDNRGSSGRGHLWEAALYRRFGDRELQDQQVGIKHLLAMGFVDEKRLGIYGWSYGGFMTLYALTQAPDLFRAGVAGAPVADWRNYDTIYTERYLGLPAENPEGYRLSSPVNFAANLKAALLLAHNLEDDNVLFQNTLQMADALQRAGKSFEMMIYPQKTHGVTGTARRHLWETIASFFERRLER